eukprot:m.244374 g.244374  ORF g.244374 m.244374 type:complete len:1483 (+) comp17147_c7_seq2:978-5426(+)
MGRRGDDNDNDIDDDDDNDSDNDSDDSDSDDGSEANEAGDGDADSGSGMAKGGRKQPAADTTGNATTASSADATDLVRTHSHELTVSRDLYATHAKKLGETNDHPFTFQKELDDVLGGCTALHVACRMENPQELISALLAHGADPNVPDRLGQTPLMYAVVAGLPAAVRSMIDHGANVNAKTKRSGQTALHLAVRLALQAQGGATARNACLALLLETGADASVLDGFGELGFCTAIRQNKQATIDLFLKYNADWRVLDGHGLSALHTAAKVNHIALIKELLKRGAEVDHLAADGSTPLHMAVHHDFQDLAKLLLEAGANANAKNQDGVFPLYRAVCNSARTVYRNFEMEQLLIDSGADIHLTTNRGRNILHAAVVSADDAERLDKARTPVDPIEIVSDICSLEGLQLDLADVFGRTPLHYASLSGAILTARYLIKRGAQPNKEDRDHNSALQLALIGHQVNYAALLLDHVHDLKHDIVYSVMRNDPVTKKPVEVVQSTSTFRFLASHHFTGLACVFIDHGVDVLSAFQDCVSVGEYQMALTLLRKTPAARVSALRDADGNTLVTFVCQHIAAEESFHSKFCALMLQTLIHDYSFPINTITASGETHLHQLCWSGATPAFRFVIDGCDVNAKREDGFDAVSLLLTGHTAPARQLAVLKLLIGHGAEVNHYDSLRATVGSHPVLKDEKRVRNIMKPTLLMYLLEHVLDQLRPLSAKEKPQTPWTPTGNAAVDAWLNDSVPTALHGDSVGIKTAMAALLIAHKLDWNHQTEDNATFIEILVRENKKAALERLISLGKAVKNPIDLNYRLPFHGQTVLARKFTAHTNTFAFTQGTELLSFLVESGCNINQLDDEGKSALWHAYRVADVQTIEHMETKLQAVMTPTTKPERPQAEKFAELALPALDVDPAKDAIAGLHDVEELLEQKKQKDGKPPGPYVDEASKLTKVARVVKMDDCDDYYDVTMTITDVSYGYWGRHDFYCMQVLYNHVQDMHILWTRWGRVGETGMHQSTPYPTKEAAVAEFCKIFKSKSHNLWENRHAFEPKAGRYLLQRHDHATIARRQEMALEVIKFEKVPSSPALPKSVDTFLRSVTDVKALRQAIVTDCEFDLAFGGAPAGTLEKAFVIIKELKAATKKLEGMSWTDEGRQELNVKVQQLTNDFYQTIPINAVKHRVRSLKAAEVAELEENLNTVAVENVTANLLLGAYHRLHASAMNPYEYIYHATHARLSPISSCTSTYATIKKYMESTVVHGGADACSIAQVFEIQRPEDVRFKEKFGQDPTRMLLWHGTKNQNVLGILSQGLRCAPPSAQVTGYMFGKGVYFADCFSKSMNYVNMGYSGGELARHHGCMFLAEVAVGHAERRAQAKAEPPGPGYDSILGMGSHVPSQSMMTLEDNVKIPLGPVEASTGASVSLAYNEYIVYDSDRIRLRYMVVLRSKEWLQKQRKRWLVAQGIIKRESDPDPQPDIVLEGDEMWEYYPDPVAQTSS